MGSGIVDPSIVNPAFWAASPAKIYVHNESQGGGDTIATGGSNWIERDGYRFDQHTGELERFVGGVWQPVTSATSFYDPKAGLSDNERLQLALGMANAPDGTDINAIREWAVSSGGFKEPSRSDGMTLGEALLYMGGAALGAGALSGASSGATAAAASETASLAAADAAAGLIPANTGGMFVGTEGLLGGTGNALADSALNGAVRSGITSAVTGRDPVQGALSGAAGGLLSTAGLGQQVASGIGATGDAGAAITSGVNAAASTAASTAIAGGSFSDILENSLTSGITQGAGSYVANALDSGSTAIDRGAGGAVTGGLNAAITGGDVGAGLLTSGLAGAAGGAATDAGYGPEVAGVVQNVTGGLLNSALQEETAIQTPAPTTTTTTTTTPDTFGGLSFSDIVPQFKDVTRSTEWGDRLFSAGRI